MQRSGPFVVGDRVQLTDTKGRKYTVVLVEGAQVAIRLTPKCGWSGKSRPEGRITSIHGAPARLRA